MCRNTERNQEGERKRGEQVDKYKKLKDPLKYSVIRMIAEFNLEVKKSRLEGFTVP